MNQTKTERLINRIREVDNFENVAYVCEDFETFIFEVAEWGVAVSYTHLTLPTKRIV